jgi:hypothetical protein
MAAILFTGKIYSSCINDLVEQTKTLQNKFASVWDNEDSNYIQLLIDNNFTIIKTEVAQQKYFNAQFIPIVNGITYLKEHGFEYVLRTRFDVVSRDYSKYIDIIKNKYPEKITVISGIQTDTIYFLQIIESGKIDDMCRFYTLQDINDSRYPEKFLIESYTNKINLTRDEIKDIFNFSLDTCIENSIEFIWYRTEGWRTPLRTIPDMKVINEYCRDTFIWTN